MAGAGPVLFRLMRTQSFGPARASVRVRRNVPSTRRGNARVASARLSIPQSPQPTRDQSSPAAVRPTARLRYLLPKRAPPIPPHAPALRDPAFPSRSGSILRLGQNREQNPPDRQGRPSITPSVAPLQTIATGASCTSGRGGESASWMLMRSTPPTCPYKRGSVSFSHDIAEARAGLVRDNIPPHSQRAVHKRSVPKCLNGQRLRP